VRVMVSGPFISEVGDADVSSGKVFEALCEE